MSEERTRSADELLFQEEAKKLGQIASEKAAKPELAETPQENTDPDTTPEVVEVETSEAETEEKEEAPEEKLSPEESSDNGLDEYGNPIAKQKTYTEEEVQRMIRERLARGKNPEAAKEAAKDFKPDPESEESWETQLGDFVEKKIQDIATKQEQAKWREREETSQAEFEDKFTTGMGKYGDFSSVVGGKPITNAMMMATRAMQDPAAFLYAACKQQPAEIERIARLQDPIAQATELGRLEERMKKARVITRAPAPPKKISGDSTTEMPKHSIDQLINQHAKSKIMNNGK